MFGSERVRVFASYLPVVLLFSDVPQLFLIWFSWRLLTITLPDYIFQKGDDIIFSVFHRTILFFCEHLTGAEVFLYGDVEQILNQKERVIYVSNHQSDADWLLAHMLALRAGGLSQVRYIVKDTIQLAPYFGHALYQHASIFVKAGQFNQAKMIKGLRYLKNPKIKTSIVLFPEGTRYNLFIDKDKDAVEYETQYNKKSGLPSLKYHLTPRSRGMSLILSELWGHFDAVYDVTMIYEGTRDSKTGVRTTSPTMFGMIRLTRPKIHIHVKRIEMKDVPKSAEDLKTWMYKIFVRKDGLLDEYYSSDPRTDVFTKGSFSRPVLSTLSKWHTMPFFIFHLVLWIPVFFYANFWFVYWTTAVLAAIGCYSWLGYRNIS